MDIYPIIQFPNSRLQIVGEPVAEVNDEIKAIVAKMFRTLYAATNCAALAATQLDIKWSDDTPKRITVIDFSEEKDQPLCLINPVISQQEGETNLREGCMSVAKITAAVKRAEKIHVDALDENGKKLSFDADGFMAKCIQHETDHLDGKLFLDHLTSLRRKMLVQKLLKKKKK